MSAAKKETIYIDAEDDITAVVESIKAAKSSIVALVIPKRAETFTSLVNMKLLNRAAKTAKKQVVLITDSSSISKLAGLANLYVAASLKSKPTIPVVASREDVVDATKSVAELAGDSVKTEDEKISTLEELATESDAKKPKGKSTKKKNIVKVPNFDAFRVKLALGVLVLFLLPVLWFVAFRVLPAATINISTNATSIQVEAKLVSSLEPDSLNAETLVIPVVEEVNKQQYREDFEATGEKQIGDKATGLMTISNCRTDETGVTVPQGTGFSSGGLTYVSQVELELDEANFNGSGQCRSSGSHVKTISVVATEPGDQYNLSSRVYDIASVSGDVVAKGGDMSGGSSETIKVVSQQDIDSAVQRLEAERGDDDIRSQLRNALSTAGLVPIEDSFTTTETDPVSSAAADDETATGTVTVNISYTMIGTKDTDALEFLLPILTEKAGDLQVIDSGIAAARYSSTRNADGSYSIEVETTGTAGLVLNKDTVFQEISGRPADEAASELRVREGITSVEVSTTPFWNSSIPNNTDKVTIQVNGE